MTNIHADRELAVDYPSLPETILCPMDLTDLSVGPLKYAGALARDFGAKLFLIHAHEWAAPCEFVPGQEQYLLAQIKIWESASGKIIHDFARQHVGDAPFDASVVETGTVQAIIQKANEVSADMIVMGTHGRSGLGRILSGSIAEEVVRAENRPVLVIRTGIRPPEPPQPLFSNILCPVNFTDVARDSLLYAMALTSKYNARLTVLYSIEPGSDELEDSARERLSKWVSEVAETHDCQIEVTEGEATEQIIDYAKKNESDLVVIGAQRRPFLKRILFGTTTEQVMRAVSCPVLVIPRHIDSEV